MRIALLILAAFVFVIPAYAQEFPDVPTDHWAYQAVQELLNAGIIEGYPDGTFSGMRALTRYEFAHAVAKALPKIEEASAGLAICGVPGKVGAAGPAGPPGITPAQLASISKLLDEFRDELSALGVDVDAIKRDVVALCDRVTALEDEVARVKITGDADMYARGEVRNTADPAFDIDSRSLSVGSSPADQDNPLANSAFFNDYDFRLRGRVGDAANIRATITTGNYLNYALARNGSLFVRDDISDFVFYDLNLDTAITLGRLGAAEVVLGRQSFQLTPLTLQFVNPDSYNCNPKLASGDYVFDGGRATFNWGRLSLSAFAAKSADLGDGFDNLMQPNLLVVPGSTGIEVSQLAGARAVVGTPLSGNLGITYYQVGLSPSVGQASIYGADINARLSDMAFVAEYAKSSPNDLMEAVISPLLGANNYAWNAKLNYHAGRLGVAAGYILVKPNYFAPGDWIRTGRAVNLQNVKGPRANLSYAFSNRLALTAEGAFLTPEESTIGVFGRTSNEQGRAVSVTPGALENLTSWRADLCYGLSAANSLNVGWEEAFWQHTSSGSATTKERYITIGFGHEFNKNASMKLLYQIVDFTAGAIHPYVQDQRADGDYRGGVAAAEFLVRY